jgi:hypothetical protein
MLVDQGSIEPRRIRSVVVLPKDTIPKSIKLAGNRSSQQLIERRAEGVEFFDRQYAAIDLDQPKNFELILQP